MRRTSWNWTKGGMAGGLRMAAANVKRVSTHHEVDPDIRRAAEEIEIAIWSLKNRLAIQQRPNK